MVWGPNIDGINSVSGADLNEYMSRPTVKVLDFLGKVSVPIVIYGATGKYMADFSEMVLRGMRMTRERSQEMVHLVSRFSNFERFQSRFGRYNGSFRLHSLDAMSMSAKELGEIPQEGLVYYGIGFKFKKGREMSNEDYARLFNMYGNQIPNMIFSYHRNNSTIVVMGSGSGLRPTAVDQAPTEEAPLEPAPDKPYGLSIRDKEATLKAVLEGGLSRAAMLRGMYFTDLTYGGLEAPVKAVSEQKSVEIGEDAFFNILLHRDAAIYMILSAEHASNPMIIFNVAGPLANKRSVVQRASEAFSKVVSVEDKDPGRYLIADGRKIEAAIGKPIDTLDDLIHAQIYWVENGGSQLGLDHHVGRSI